MRRILVAGVIGLGGVVHGAAAQETPQDIGVLACNLLETTQQPVGPEAGEGAPAGQAIDLLCSFRPTRSSLEETYLGTLQGIGDQQELRSRRTMMWVVKSAANEVPPGVLQQSYSADAKSGAGQPAPLIGQADRNIVLQSMSEEERPVPTDKTAAEPMPRTMIVTMELRLRSSPA